MSADRRDRVSRLTSLAETEQQRAQAEVQVAAAKVRAVDGTRAEALAGASFLADQAVPVALRGHLVNVGARYLSRLADDKGKLVEELDHRRDALQEATRKVRSLERLGERLDQAERRKQHRRDAADLADLVAIDAAGRGRS